MTVSAGKNQNTNGNNNDFLFQFFYK
jgi:hypothetical protein